MHFDFAYMAMLLGAIYGALVGHDYAQRGSRWAWVYMGLSFLCAGGLAARVA